MGIKFQNEGSNASATPNTKKKKILLRTANNFFNTIKLQSTNDRETVSKRTSHAKKSCHFERSSVSIYMIPENLHPDTMMLFHVSQILEEN